MDIYLDLSFIANIIIHSLSLLYVYIMFEFKNKIYKNILIILLLSILVLTLPFFIIDEIIIYLIYDLLILIALLPNKQKLYMIISYISIYYILIGLISFIVGFLIAYLIFSKGKASSSTGPLPLAKYALAIK